MPEYGVASADGVIQVAPDSTGKKVDNSQVTRDDGTIVYRQRIAIADDDSVLATASVSGEQDRGALGVVDRNVMDALSALQAVMEEVRDLLKELIYS